MKQSSKRFLSMILSLAFVVASFVLFFDLVQPTYADLSELKGKQLSLVQDVSNEQELVSHVNGLIGQYANGSLPTSTVALAMPSGPDVADALAQIYGIATADSINIQSIAISAPHMSSSGGAAASQGLKPKGSFTLQVSASGSYESLKLFLSTLESNIRVFNVTQFSLEPVASAASAGGKGGANDSFFYNLGIKTYYQVQ